MPDSTAELRDAARSFTRSAYGKDLEEKASDAFCLEVLDKRQTAGRLTVGFEAVGGSPPLPAVIEFDPSAVQVPGREARPAGERRRRRAAPENAVPGDRTALLEQVRMSSYQAMASVYNEIERLTATPVGPAPEFVGVPVIPTAVTQWCWLNRTLRTWAGPEALADVMGDSSVTRVDLPRRLEAEDTPVNHKTIKLPKFLERTNLTGAGVIVAVLDSEVALHHPALQGRIMHRRNYTAENWGSPHRHGTAVAGLVAADDADAAGVAPGAFIYNYKVLATNRFLNADDFGGTLAIQQAVEDNAAVVNCSWGVGPATGAKTREAIAVDAAWALGVVVVKSAGNNGPGRKTVTSPAEADGVIVVGATNLAGNEIADYSSRGPAGTVKRPHLVAPGGGDDGSLVCALVTGGFGDAGQGTSYAAPQVSGAAALLLEENRNLTPDQLRDKLTGSAKKLTGVSADAQGAGLMQLS